MPSPLRRTAAALKLETQAAPTPVKAHAEWADRYLGDHDGSLTADELDAFQRDWGHVEGMTERVINPLRQALAARVPAPRPEPVVTPTPTPVITTPTPVTTTPTTPVATTVTTPAATVTTPTPQPAAPTFTVGQLMRGEHRTMPLSSIPATGFAQQAARLADQAFGNGDGHLDSSELRELENVSAYRAEAAVLRDALARHGRVTADPTMAPPEGAPAMGVSVASLPQGIRPLAEFADRNGNFDGVLDSREVTEHGAALVRTNGGASLSDTNLGVLRLMHRLVNSGAPVAGVTMRADGTGAVASWPPPASRMLAAPEAVSAERRALATRLVQGGGSATQQDVDAVVAEVARLPLPVLRALEANNTPIRVGRENVTDVEPSLRRERPRGWVEGRTFAEAPGIYHPPSRSVILSTEDDGRGGRRLSDDHGSLDLLVHEVAHALDLRDAFGVARGNISDSREFREAYDADRANMARMGRSYLTQHGEAGREEAFAEAFAAYVSGNQFMPETTPNLRAYFDRLFERLD